MSKKPEPYHGEREWPKGDTEGVGIRLEEADSWVFKLGDPAGHEPVTKEQHKHEDDGPNCGDADHDISDHCSHSAVVGKEPEGGRQDAEKDGHDAGALVKNGEPGVEKGSAAHDVGEVANLHHNYHYARHHAVPPHEPNDHPQHEALAEDKDEVVVRWPAELAQKPAVVLQSVAVALPRLIGGRVHVELLGPRSELVVVGQCEGHRRLLGEGTVNRSAEVHQDCDEVEKQRQRPEAGDGNKLEVGPLGQPLPEEREDAEYVG
mmetsp:Transcript_16803/g.29090  ORF Transcript_16803/g.29090 Transcript_16803/m.29090 type:complete len:262 (+) Transcript_16803:174-959(+)